MIYVFEEKTLYIVTYIREGQIYPTQRILYIIYEILNKITGEKKCGSV
jgi:hypothetical protein